MRLNVDRPYCHRHRGTRTRNNGVAKNVVLLAFERKRLGESHDGSFGGTVLFEST